MMVLVVSGVIPVVSFRLAHDPQAVLVQQTFPVVMKPNEALINSLDSALKSEFPKIRGPNVDAK